MSIQKQTLIQFNNISLTFGDRIILDNISGSILRGDKIGLIGINGSGKSSLLKTIAGLISSQSGIVNRNCAIEYIPQLDLELYRKQIPLYKHLEEIHEDWWQVFEQYERLFRSSLKEDRILSTLSGGELVKLNLALAFAKLPEVVLLDEPTNHLDLRSLSELKTIMQKTDITFVVVSHNVSFLNSVVRTVWEIDNGKLFAYGGNYDFYKEQKTLQQDAIQRRYEEKQKALRKLVIVKQQEQKRAQRSKKVGTDIGKRHDRSADRFATGFFKNASEKSAAKKKAALEDRENDLIAGIAELKRIPRKNIHLELINHRKSGLVLAVENGRLILPNGRELVSNINASIYHGDRIAILGDNGTGKTTLAKQFVYNKHKMLFGKVRYGSEYKTLFVDQKYDLINPELSIIENIQKNNKNIIYEDIRKVLGNMCFPDDYDVNKVAKTLSGGETARLAFAIATNCNIDVLVLDEPTNNLDIDTIEVISKALADFKGTMIVISHDTNFLKEIGIHKCFVIENHHLTLESVDNLI